MKKSTRQTTQYCHWVGQIVGALLKTAVQYPVQTLLTLGTAFADFGTANADTSEEADNDVILIRPVSDQVARTSDNYDVTLKPENYLASDNIYQRFDIQSANGVKLPNWLTITKAAELEEIIHNDVEDTFNNADAEQGLLFVAAGKAGVKVYNISDERHPRLASIIPTPGNAMSVDVQLPYLYVADGSEGFQIWNLTEGLFPSNYVSQIKGLWIARDVRVNNTIAYVAAETAGIRIINTEDLSQPQELTPYIQTVTAYGLCFYQSYLLFADGPNGLVIMAEESGQIKEVNRLTPFHWEYTEWVGVQENQIYLRDDKAGKSMVITVRGSDPWEFESAMVDGKIATLPRFIQDDYAVFIDEYHPFGYWQPDRKWGFGWISIMNMPGQGIDIYIQNDLAYIALDIKGFLIVDIGDPHQPVQLGYIDTPGAAASISVQGNVAYIADLNNGLQLIDVSDPRQPQTLASIQTRGWAYGLAVKDNLAYVANYDEGLSIIDVSDPSNLLELGFISTPGAAVGVAVSGELAYVADGLSGLRVIDVSNSVEPIEVGFIVPEDSRVFALEVNEDLVFVAGSYGLLIIDVSTPTQPAELGRYGTLGNAWSVTVKNQLAYVAEWEKGLYIIDVSDPANPIERGLVSLQRAAWGLAVQDNLAWVVNGLTPILEVIEIAPIQYPHELSVIDAPNHAFAARVRDGLAYVAADRGGLRIIDINDPTKPFELGVADTPDEAIDVALYGDLAFVPDWGSGLRLINVSDPTQPVTISVYDTPGDARGVVVKNDLAYVADNREGLRVVNVSDLYQPHELGSFKVVDRDFIGLVERNNLVYVADGMGALRIVDVSNPGSPFEAGFIETGGSSWGVTLKGNLAFVAGANLLIIDISNPVQPLEVGFSPLPAKAAAVTVEEDIAYVASGVAGFRVLDVRDPQFPVEIGSVPTQNNVRAVTLDEHLAYLADGEAGLRIVDVAGYQKFSLALKAERIAQLDGSGYCAALTPHDLGYFDPSGKLVATKNQPLAYKTVQWAAVKPRDATLEDADYFSRPVINEITAFGRYVVTQAHNKVLSVYQWENQTLALVHEQISTLRTYKHVALADGILAVSWYEARGLQLRNVSEAGAAGVFSNLPSVSTITALALERSKLYVADPGLGMVLYDVAAPGLPQQLGSWAYTQAELKKLHVENQMVFTSAVSTFFLIDAIDTQQPLLIHSVDLGAPIYDFIIMESGDKIAFALGEQGIKIFRPKNNAKQWLNKIRLSGIRPALDKSIYSLELVSSDVTASTAKTPPFMLNYQHPPVVIAEINDREINVFDVVTIQFTPEFIFNDADGDPLVLSMVNLPSWLDFDSQTNQLTGQVLPGSQGDYLLNVIADDGQGGEASTGFKLTVLNRAPVLPSLRDAEVFVGEIHQQSYPNLLFDPDQDSLTATLKLASQPLPSWVSWNVTSGLLTVKPPPGSQNSYPLEIVVKDPFGLSDSQSLLLTVPNRSPEVTSINSLEVLIGEHYQEQFEAPLVNDADADPLTTTIQLSTGLPLPGWLRLDLHNNTLSVEPTLGSQGNYRVRVRVEDPFGNSAQSQFTVTVPNRAPVLPNLRDVEVFVGQTYQQTYPNLLFDPDGDMLQATLTLSDQRLPTWVSWNLTSGLLTIEPPIGTQGEYSLEMVVKDPDGSSDRRSLSISVPNRAPLIQGFRDFQTVIGLAWFKTYDKLVVDPDQDVVSTTLTFNDDALPSWIQFNASASSVSVLAPPASQGSYNLQLNAMDALGLTTTAEVVLTIPNRAPQFVQPLREQRAQLNQLFSWILPASVAMDPDQDPLQFRAEIPSALGWLSFNSTRLEFTGKAAQLTDAPETIVLTVSDGELAAITELPLSVIGSLVVNRRDGQAALTYTEEQSLQLPVLQIVTPANNASVTFSLSDRSAGALADSNGRLPNPLPSRFELSSQVVSSLNQQLANITFIPSQDYNRDLTIRVVVNDRLNLPATLEWFITGTNVNDLPQLAQPIGVIAATEDEAFLYIIPQDTFSDADGDALSYRVTGVGQAVLPDGFSYHPDTLTLTGTPREAGELSFEVRAQDRIGESLPHVFHVKVAPGDSLVNKEDLIALLPVGLTVTLVLAALSCYQRGRIKLQHLQALLQKIDLKPLLTSLDNQRVNQAELGRLFVLLQQSYVGQADYEGLRRLLSQFIQHGLRLGMNDPQFSPVGHQAYLHLLKLHLLPATRHEVTQLAKKATVKSRYSERLITQAYAAVQLFELMLLLDSRQGRPINEIERLDMLMIVHYSIRNLKPKIQNYPLLKLHLLRARAALSSVRDTDTMRKFVLRALGRVVPTFFSLFRFNARQWYADILKLKYQWAYQIEDQASPAWLLFKQSQARYLKHPFVLSGYIEAMQTIYQRTKEESLKTTILNGMPTQGFLGLKQLASEAIDPMVRAKARWVQAQLWGANTEEMTSLQIAPVEDESKEAIKRNTSYLFHTNPLALAERSQRQFNSVRLFNPERQARPSAKTKRPLTKLPVRYDPTLVLSGTGLSWQPNPLNKHRSLSRARLFEVSGRIVNAPTQPEQTESSLPPSASSQPK